MEKAFLLSLLRLRERDAAASLATTGGPEAPSIATGGAAASSATTGGTAASLTTTCGTPANFAWGMSQELHKSPKPQVVQPPHPPPVEVLIKGTVEEVLEGHIIVPQPLCYTTELRGKLPHVSALLTEGAQSLKLEDALVERAGEKGGWWMAQALPLLSPHNG